MPLQMNKHGRNALNIVASKVLKLFKAGIKKQESRLD